MSENASVMHDPNYAGTKESLDFAARAEQILSTEPILMAKDVEVQFGLRGKTLTAIRKHIEMAM